MTSMEPTPAEGQEPQGGTPPLPALQGLFQPPAPNIPDLQGLLDEGGYSIGEMTHEEAGRVMQTSPNSRRANLDEHLQVSIKELQAAVTQRDQEFLTMVVAQQGLQAAASAMQAADDTSATDQQIQQLAAGMGSAEFRVPEFRDAQREQLAEMLQNKDLTPEQRTEIQNLAQRSQDYEQFTFALDDLEYLAGESTRHMAKQFGQPGALRQMAEEAAPQLGLTGEGPLSSRAGYIPQIRENLSKLREDFLTRTFEPESRGAFEQPWKPEASGVKDFLTLGMAQPDEEGQKIQDYYEHIFKASPTPKALRKAFTREEIEPLITDAMRRASEKALKEFLDESGTELKGEDRDSIWRGIGSLGGMLLPLGKGAQAAQWTGKGLLGILGKAGLKTLGKQGAKQSIMEIGEKLGSKALGRFFVRQGAPAAALGGFFLAKDPSPEMVQDIDERIRKGQLASENRDDAIEAAQMGEALRWAAFWPIYSAAGAVGHKAGGWVEKLTSRLGNFGSKAAGGLGGGAVMASLFPLAGQTGEEAINLIKHLSADEQNWLSRQMDLGIIAGAGRTEEGGWSPVTASGKFMSALASGDTKGMGAALSEYAHEVKPGMVVFGALGLIRAARSAGFENKLWTTAEDLQVIREKMGKAIDQIAPEASAAKRAELKRLLDEDIKAVMPGKEGPRTAYERANYRLEQTLREHKMEVPAREVKATDRVVTRKGDRPTSIDQEIQRVRRDLETEKDEGQREVLEADKNYLTYKRQAFERSEQGKTHEAAVANTRAEAWRNHAEKVKEWNENPVGRSPKPPSTQEFEALEGQAVQRQFSEELLGAPRVREIQARTERYATSPQRELDRVNDSLREATDKLSYEAARRKRLHGGKQYREALEDVGLWMEKELQAGDRLRLPNGQEMVVVGSSTGGKGVDYQLQATPVGERSKQTTYPLRILTPRDFGDSQLGGRIEVIQRGVKVPEAAARQLVDTTAQLRASESRRLQESIEDAFTATEPAERREAVQRATEVIKAREERVEAEREAARQVRHEAELPSEDVSRGAIRSEGGTGDPIRDGTIRKTAEQRNTGPAAAELAGENRTKLLTEGLLEWAEKEDAKAAERKASPTAGTPRKTPPRPTGPAFHPGANQVKMLRKLEEMEDMQSRFSEGVLTKLGGTKRAGRQAEIERMREGNLADEDRELLSAASEIANRSYGPERFLAESVYEALMKRLGLPVNERLGDTVKRIQRKIPAMVEEVRQRPGSFTEFVAQNPELQGPVSVAMRYYPAGLKLAKAVQDLYQIARSADVAGTEAMMWAFRGSAGAGVHLGLAKLKSWWLTKRMRQYDAWTKEYFVDPFDRSIHTGPIRSVAKAAISSPIGRYFQTPANWLGWLGFDAGRMEMELAKDIQAGGDIFFSTSKAVPFFGTKRGLFGDIKPDSPRDYLMQKLVIDRQEKSKEWAEASEADRDAARKARNWNEQLRINTIETLPETKGARHTIDALKLQKIRREEDLAAAKGLVGESQKFMDENPQIAKWRDRRDQIRAAIKKANNAIRDKAKKGKEVPQELRDMLKAAEAEERDIRKNIAETLSGAGVLDPVDLLGKPGTAKKGRIKQLEEDIEFIDTTIKQLEGDIERRKRFPWEGGWGTGTEEEAYHHDIPMVRTTVRDYGDWGEVGADHVATARKNGLAKYVSSTILKKKDVKSGLYAQGKQDPSFLRSQSRFIKKALTINHQARYQARIHDRLFGQLRPIEDHGQAHLKTLLFPRRPEHRQLKYQYDRIPDLKSLGIHTRKFDAEGKTTFEKGAKDGKQFVLLWRGSQANLNDAQSIKEAIKKGNLIAVPRGRAGKHIFAKRGGLISKLDPGSPEYNNLHEWMNGVLRVGDQMQTGELEKGLSKAFRTLGYLESTKVLGANPMTLANAVLGAAAYNLTSITSPAKFVQSLSYMAGYPVRLAKARFSGDTFRDLATSEYQDWQARPQFFVDKMANRLRTPPEELAKMTPKARAHAEMLDNMYVDYYSSGVGSGTRGFVWDQWRTDQGPLRGAGEKAWSGLQKSAWIGFEMMESMVRIQLYGAVYTDAIAAGRTREQAKDLAAAQVMANHAVFNYATRSKFYNSIAGPTFGGVISWMSHASGKFLRSPGSQKVKLFATLLGLYQVFKMFDTDVSNVLGTPIHEIGQPFSDVGETAEAYAAGVGVETEDDPRGLEEKSLFGIPFNEFFNSGAFIPPFSASAEVPWTSDLMTIGRWLNDFAAGDEEAGWGGKKTKKTLVQVLEPTALKYLRRAGVEMPYEDKPSVGEFVEGKGYPYTPPFGDKVTEYLPATGIEQYAIDLLPGSYAPSARTWFEDRMSRARRDIEEVKRSNLSNRARGLAQRFLQVDELGGQGEDVTLEREQLFDELKGLNEAGEPWGVEYKGKEMLGLMKDEKSMAGMDRRAQNVIKALSNRAKIEELVRLLEDTDYEMDKKYGIRILDALRGSKGVGEWISDNASPQLQEQFLRAWDARFPRELQSTGGK